MSRTLYRLKRLAVDKAKNPGRYADGGGLYLIVKPGPRKSWAFIYRRGAKMTELGLGAAADVTLMAARTEAAELRAVLREGAATLGSIARASGRPRPSRMPARSRSRRPPGPTTSGTLQIGGANATRGNGYAH